LFLEIIKTAIPVKLDQTLSRIIWQSHLPWTKLNSSMQEKAQNITSQNKIASELTARKR
jgi:hypothetical protein